MKQASSSIVSSMQSCDRNRKGRQICQERETIGEEKGTVDGTQNERAWRSLDRLWVNEGVKANLQGIRAETSSSPVHPKPSKTQSEWAD